MTEPVRAPLLVYCVSSAESSPAAERQHTLQKHWSEGIVLNSEGIVLFVAFHF